MNVNFNNTRSFLQRVKIEIKVAFPSWYVLFRISQFMPSLCILHLCRGGTSENFSIYVLPSALLLSGLVFEGRVTRLCRRRKGRDASPSPACKDTGENKVILIGATTLLQHPKDNSVFQGKNS